MKMYLVASISFLAMAVLAIVNGFAITAGTTGLFSGYFFNEWRWHRRIERVQRIAKIHIAYENERLQERKD